MPGMNAAPDEELSAAHKRIFHAAGLTYLGGYRPDLRLDEIAIYDPESTDLLTGSLVLLAIEDPMNAESAARTAVAQGAAGVVIGSWTPQDHRRSIQELGVVVLERPPELNWLQTVTALRVASSEVPDVDSVKVGVTDGDLLALAETLADVLGGPIVIEDARFNVLAYSTYAGSFDHGRDSTILGRRTPQEWVDHLSADGTLQVLAGSDSVVEIMDGPRGARRRLVSGLRAEGEFLGLLWLAEGDNPLRPDADRLLMEAAVLTAAHVIHYQSHMRERATSHGFVVKSLLDGSRVSQSAVEQLGLKPSSRHAVLGLRLRQASDVGPRTTARLIDTVTTYCQAYRWAAASCGIGNAVYVIADLPKAGTTTDSYLRLVEGLGQGLLETCEHAFGGQVIVAVSDASPRLNAMPGLMVQVDRSLDHCSEQPGAGGVVTFHESRNGIALRLAADAVRADPILRFPELDVLREMDRDEGTDYVRTLKSYLHSLGNARVAAEALGIHLTTLRYRLSRIEHIAGIDIGDADTRQLYGLLLRVTPDAG